MLPQMEYVIAYDMITGDLDDEVGGKNAHIGEIRNRLGLAVPEGFAVTTRAFRTFFSHNGIEDQLSQILQAWRENQFSSEAASQSITAMIAIRRPGAFPDSRH